MEFGDKSLTELYKHLHISLRFVLFITLKSTCINQNILQSKKGVLRSNTDKTMIKRKRTSNDQQNSIHKKNMRNTNLTNTGGTKIIRKGRQLTLH